MGNSNNTQLTTIQIKHRLISGYIHQKIDHKWDIIKTILHRISLFHGALEQLYKTRSFTKIYELKSKNSVKKSIEKTHCIRKSDQEEFMVILIDLKNINDEEKSTIMYEPNLMSGLHHINICPIHDIFVSKKKIHLIYNKLADESQELFDRVTEKGYLNEITASHIMKQLLSALSYLHDFGIAHRNINVENIIINENDNILLSDFAMANSIAIKGVFNTPLGTPNYVAPEILRRKDYDTQCDMWSIGVVLYIILCGFPPFYDDNDDLGRLYRKIKRAQYEMPSPYWDDISMSAKDLVKKILITDPNKRLTAKEALKHDWIQNINNCIDPRVYTDKQQKLDEKKECDKSEVIDMENIETNVGKRVFRYYDRAFSVSNGGKVIQANYRSTQCQGYLVFPECEGFRENSRGIHYWSVKCCVAQCFRQIGLMQVKRSLDQYTSMGSKTAYKWLIDYGNDYHENYFKPPHYSSKEWNVNEIITITLDCDRKQISMVKGDEKIYTHAIDLGVGQYFFVARLCAQYGHLESVSTPFRHMMDDEKIQLLTSGYIRKIEFDLKFSQNIPQEIVDIIFEYGKH